MRVLAADTSTNCGSVAIVDFDPSINSGILLAESLVTKRETHNRRLMVKIDELLKELGFSIKDIDAFAVGVGPGSFTGLRIGITTFKTIAWSLKKPIKGVPSLFALACPFAFTSHYVCPMIDARKKEVYWTLFKCNGHNGLEQVFPYSVDSPQTVVKKIDHPTVFCGDGWVQYKEYFWESLNDRVLEPSPEFHAIRSSHIAFFAARCIADGDEDDPVKLIPLYVRPSEAEINNPDIKLP